MLLAIDIGNSNIVIGFMKSKTEFRTMRIASDSQKTSDEYAIDLNGLLNLYRITPEMVDGAIISSVVPQLRVAFQSAVKMIFGLNPLIVGPGIRTGLNILIDDPAEIGGDLVVASVAVAKEYPLPAAIVDMGTATTVTVLNEKGAFMGGAICAGLRISANALASNTALLPDVSMETPKRVIGKNTVDCIQSGMMYGAAAMLDGLISRMEQEYGKKLYTVITGGIAKFVAPLCQREMKYDDDLLLKGMWIIYHLNQK